MEPKLIEFDTMLVAGKSVRTSNVNETTPGKAKIHGLWQSFFEDGIHLKIDSALPGSPIYGIYSNYESDAHGEYDVTAGVGVSEASGQFSNVEIAGGKYLVFNAEGEMPKIVVDTWMKIWTYFQSSKQYKRLFNTDFEVYRGPNAVEIFIGVEERA